MCQEPVFALLEWVRLTLPSPWYVRCKLQESFSSIAWLSLQAIVLWLDCVLTHFCTRMYRFFLSLKAISCIARRSGHMLRAVTLYPFLLERNELAWTYNKAWRMLFGLEDSLQIELESNRRVDSLLTATWAIQSCYSIGFIGLLICETNCRLLDSIKIWIDYGCR